ncbi:MAG: hypothetical protein GY847_18940 [Proteobacteria bacterium]|nr:hypothetical protein [Pseudomonadota bacterium]
MKNLWIVVVCIVVLGCTRPVPTHVSPKSHESHKSTLSQRINLSNWGIRHPTEIGHVSLGILHFPKEDQLKIYNVRRQPPIPKDRQIAIQTRQPPMKNGHFLIAHFDYGNTNTLGGYFSSFAKSPSRSQLMLDPAPDNVRSLVFSYLKAKEGFTGFWIHLFDFKSLGRAFLDVKEVGYLTFSVRGESGDESLVLQVADRNWESKGDSLPVGSVSEFLHSGKIESQWQQAWVPMDRFPSGIELNELASIVFVADRNGQGRVFFKDMAFAMSKDVTIKPPSPRSSVERQLRTALWIWETEKIAGSQREIKSLLTFCRDHGVSDVFLQIPSSGPSRLRQLIRRLHNSGIRVDALDGDPRFALEERHEQVLTAVRKVIKYNRGVESLERYDGIRYDNEPYLLPNYGGVHKQSVLRQYLTLLKRIRSLTSEAHLSFGVDIPFWFDGRNRFFELNAEVDGRPLSELIIDEVDNLAIMDYRTQAYGPDGVIAHGVDELEYATKRGKQIYIGLETVYLPDETIQAFGHEGKGAMILLDDFDGTSVRASWFSKLDWESLSNIKRSKNDRVLAQVYEAQAPASKLTFDKWSLKDLRRVINHSKTELMHLPSFYGFAIHSYESYRPWLERAENVSK